ncbi:hypothetical protein BS329_20660 [Amycolatopsis coloradensis]|uniref:Uncharacterized protein n=1 Tax=Amycolatopsis coloradensis TaxID=76021 RepID=A0A1R0KQS5_9PSEU|nr:hypothetical protein BS329_20660 [Amycolatopsis coloradensis]
MRASLDTDPGRQETTRGRFSYLAGANTIVVRRHLLMTGREKYVEIFAYSTGSLSRAGNAEVCGRRTGGARAAVPRQGHRQPERQRESPRGLRGDGIGK